MDNPKHRSIWRQARVIALLPFAIFLWMTGWTLYQLGEQVTSSKAAKKKQCK